MASHQWHLVVPQNVRKNLKSVPKTEWLNVFRGIRQLLLADNPQAVSGVKKLVEKRFEGQWRQRSGDWRIFFTIDSMPVTHLKFTYKGTITIHAVVRRDEAY